MSRSVYVESMGKTLLSLFKIYCTQLMKLDLVVATKNDLIAVEEATLKSVFTQKVAVEMRGRICAIHFVLLARRLTLRKGQTPFP